MNRKESFEIINRIERHLANQGMTDEEYRLDEALVTLGVYKQPDPITGLVPCGCGGKAELHPAGGVGNNDVMAECTTCSVAVICETKEEAIRVWNEAMGYKEDEE